MAVVDDSNQTQEQQWKSVDLTSTNLEAGEQQTVNPDEDAWASPPPPPDNIKHRVKVFLARDGMQGGKDDDGKQQYRANLELRIVDGPYQNATIFANCSTQIGRGKEISSMAGVMLKLGLPKDKLPKTGSPLQFAQLMAKVLKAEPQAWVEGEWAAGWMEAQRKFMKVGMKNFPDKPGGGKQDVITDPQGNKYKAKFRVTRWYSTKEITSDLAKQTSQAPAAPATGGSGFTGVPASSTSTATTSVSDDDLILDS